ncbi:hypothetical protein E1193_28030 [Micromonospora sp. KC606]|nr:hypothetical protein E1193_28030 [Micromonospora sp. KC606]
MGAVELVVGRPDARLRPFVARYLGNRDASALLLVCRQAAGAFVVVILGAGVRRWTSLTRVRSSAARTGWTRSWRAHSTLLHHPHDRGRR